VFIGYDVRKITASRKAFVFLCQAPHQLALHAAHGVHESLLVVLVHPLKCAGVVTPKYKLYGYVLL